MNDAADNSILFGRFYPEYDIAVSLLWTFIILSGFGNWAVMWCILKTKSLRKPFNMMVLALCFANGVSTTVIGPMDLIRTLMAHNQVTVDWCNARVLLKTFCYSISMMIIFTLSVMRLRAGLRKTLEKLTFKMVSSIIAVIYGLAIITAPVFLDQTTAIHRTCMGIFTDMKLILQNEGLLPTENITVSTEMRVTQASTSNNGIWFASTESTTEATAAHLNLTSPGDDMVKAGKKTPEFYLYYLAFTLGLFIGTVVCYIVLTIVLKRRKNVIKFMVLGNSKDILTLRVTAYVTCTFFVSFLVPFLPGLISLPTGNTAARLHYVSIFHCLSFLDGGIAPIILYFSNAGYRKALLKVLPPWMTRYCWNSSQIAPAPAPAPAPVLSPVHIPQQNPIFQVMPVASTSTRALVPRIP